MASWWFQNVLTGEQREVKTLDEADFYVKNVANWCRIKAPSPSAAKPKAAPKPTAKPKD